MVSCTVAWASFLQVLGSPAGVHVASPISLATGGAAAVIPQILLSALQTGPMFWGHSIFCVSLFSSSPANLADKSAADGDRTAMEVDAATGPPLFS